MDYDKIKELIEAVSKSNLTRFEVEEGGLKISMRTDKDSKNIVVAASQTAAVPQVEETAGSMVVKSPLVGTFYCAPNVDAKPYVQVGDVVKKGQVLGIVEAMKLMNEIESEFEGEIKETLVENKQMVEDGRPQFVIGSRRPNDEADDERDYGDYSSQTAFFAD